MLRGGRWGTPSMIAGFGDVVHTVECTTSYHRNGDDNDSYYGSVHCNLPTVRIFALSPSKQMWRVQVRQAAEF